jgi:hypothetical protein
VQGDQICGCKPPEAPARLASADLVALLTPAKRPAARQQRSVTGIFFVLFASSWLRAGAKRQVVIRVSV